MVNSRGYCIAAILTNIFHFHKEKRLKYSHSQRWIQDFPEEGTNRKGGHQPIILANPSTPQNSEKMKKNGPGWRLWCLLGSANAFLKRHKPFQLV